MVATQVNGQGDAVQPIGTAMIVHGTVTAESAQGVTRTLQLNSPIFANDRIMTGSDGMISIVFGDTAHTQLDLGRMSDMVIDEDVFPGEMPTDIAEATMEVEQIQQALLEGEFDPTQDLEATAAGPAAAGAASDGGGISSVRFELTADEVTPESGAETIGIGYDFLDPNPPVLEPLIAPVVPTLAVAAPTAAPPTPTAIIPPPPPPFIPPPPPTLDVDRVVEEEAMNPEMQTLGHIWEIEGEDASTVDNWSFTVGSGGSWISIDLLSEQSPWWAPSWIDLDGDPDQANLDPHIRLYHDDGSGGLGAEVNSSDWSWPWQGGEDGSSTNADPYLYVHLNEGNYILVVGDSYLSQTSAQNGINPDSGDIEFGPYQIRLTGNLAITDTPDDGYITSMPSLSDGNQDQNDGPEDLLQPDSAVVTGNLGPGSWSIISTDGLPHLQSQGGDITYELKNPAPGVYVLEAWVRYDGMPEPTSASLAAADFEQIGYEEDRLVFTLQVEADGDYTFTLLDQLDNTPPGTALPDGVLDMSLLDPAGAEENIELMVFDEFGTPIGWIDNLDFSQNLQVVVPFYGAVTFPAGSFTITTVDDIPVALNVCHASMIRVEEDGMMMDQGDEGNWYWDPDADNGTGAWVTDPDLSDGNQQAFPPWVDDNFDDEDWAGSGSTDSIARLFKVGADEYPEDRGQEFFSEATFGITENQEILDELPQLWSHGEMVSYKLVGGNTLVAYIPGEDEPPAEAIFAAAETQIPEGSEDRVVFTLTINSDGSWHFDLDDQLDHVAGYGENWALITGADGQDYMFGLDLSSILTATDYDFDTLTGAMEGSFILRVQDDIPKLVCQANVSADVAESALSTGYWTSGQEWLPDSSEGFPHNNPWNPDETDADTASDSHNSTGSLLNLVSVGADEELKFSLIDNTSGLPNLYSKGEQLHYSVDVTAGILIATAGEFGPTVFTLEVNEDGSWSFDLDDQLDHVDDGKNDQNTELRTNQGGTTQTSYIDLSNMIQAVDYDGDAVTLHPGMFTITVEDDIPVIKCWASVGGFVEEDGMTESLDPGDYDNSEGNPDGWGDDYNDDEFHSFGSQSLASLVLADGADEDVTFTFSNEAINYMEAQGLSSQSEALQYSIDNNTNTLTGFTSNGTVFSLIVNENGSWSFDLDDQLDHTLDWGQNWTLQGENQWNWYVDFSGAVVAVDYDGDEASLHDGQFTMAIQDDIPITEYSGETFYVSEYAGYDNIVGTYTLNLWGRPTNPDIVIESTNDEGNMNANEHHVGAYEPGTKFFIIADGANQLPDDLSNLKIVWNGSNWVPRIDGTTYSDVPIYFMDSYLNPDGADHFMDENGNPLSFIPPEGAEVHIEDLPNLGDADYDDAVLRVEVGPSVNEANLADGTDPTDDAGRTVYGDINDGTGGLKISVGADEPGTLYVNANEITQYNDGFNYTDPKSSNPAMLVMDGDGDSITILSQTGILIVHDDGSWQYTLVDNTLVHPDNDPGGADHTDGDSDRGTGDQVQDVFDLQFHDFDGDYVFPQIVININDDGPEIGTPQDSVMANTYLQDPAITEPAILNELTANLSIDYGADGPGGITLGLEDTAPVMAMVDGAMQQIHIFQNGALFWHEEDANTWSAETTSGFKAFTVSVDEGNGTYNVKLFTELDGAGGSTIINFGDDLNGGNPDQAVFGDGDIIGTGINPIDQDPTTIYGNSIFLLAQGSEDLAGDFGGDTTPYSGTDTFGADSSKDTTVNYSNQGIGVGGGAKIDDIGTEAGRQSEILSLKFLSQVEVETGNKGDYVSGTALAITSATVLLDHIGYDDTAYFSLWKDGVQVSGELSYSPTSSEAKTAGGSSSIDLAVTFTSDNVIADASNPSLEFDEIRFEAGSNYRVVAVEINENVEGFDQTIIVPFEVMDGDGDTAEDSFSITFDGTGAIDAQAADAVDGDVSTEGMVISGSYEADIIIGTDYDDTADGGDGDDVMSGGDGADTLLGGLGDDIIDGGEGDDLIFGHSGDDVIIGDGGEDYIDGGPDNDSIVGGDDDDILLGNTGDDNLYGDDGGDTLLGEEGNDQLIGGDGADLLEGGTGDNDILVGDVVIYTTETDGTITSEVVEEPIPVEDTIDGDTVADVTDDITTDTAVDASFGDLVPDVGDLDDIADAGTVDDLDNLIPPPDTIV